MEHSKCFISYSWDSEEHKNWVRHLGEILQENGVYIHLDQWDVKLGMDLPQYMEKSIRECPFVILVCTPIFARKANEGTGGVGYEKNIVTGELFTSTSSNTKFIPVIRSGSASTSLPSYLKSKLYVDFTSDSSFELGIEAILRHIHDAPEAVRPQLGQKPTYMRLDSNTDIVTQTAKEQDGQSFDLERFEELKEYAYSASGLNMTKSEAAEWAENRLKDSSSFDLERFEELKEYAYSASGLDMTKSEAAKWALSKLRG